MQMIQTELGRGNVRLVTWLPRDKRVWIGSVISFNKEGDHWTVLNQSDPVDTAQSPIMHGWHVGGL